MIGAMQSLNLSGETKKSDGRLKSLFWPTVENAWDVDYLGQQGFWLCFAIAAINLALILMTAFAFHNTAGRITVMILGGIIFFVFVVGGMGVRESSWPAAAMVFTLYILNQLGSGTAPGVLSIIIAGVLLSNVRATFLASRWKPADENEDRPMRFNETLRDKLVDQLPPKLWPVLKFPFFVTSSFVLAFLIYVSAMLLLHKPAASQMDENVTPSTTVTVDPPK
jgi:hypothetical protein